MTDTDLFSTCESQVIKKNDFFLTKTEKLLSYSKSICIHKVEQKIGEIIGNEIEQETSNIKSFYDNEIREKLIKIILEDNKIKESDNGRHESSFLTLCSIRKEKIEMKNKDDSNSSDNKEESICILI